MIVIYSISVLYSTARFKLERTPMRYGLDMTDISFYTCASMYTHARLMMSHLSFKTLCTYAIDKCMTVCRQMHICQQHTCQIWITCMHIVSQG